MHLSHNDLTLPYFKNSVSLALRNTTTSDLLERMRIFLKQPFFLSVVFAHNVGVLNFFFFISNIMYFSVC